MSRWYFFSVHWYSVLVQTFLPVLIPSHIFPSLNSCKSFVHYCMRAYSASTRVMTNLWVCTALMAAASVPAVSWVAVLTHQCKGVSVRDVMVLPAGWLHIFPWYTAASDSWASSSTPLISLWNIRRLSLAIHSLVFCRSVNFAFSSEVTVDFLQPVNVV